MHFDLALLLDMHSHEYAFESGHECVLENVHERDCEHGCDCDHYDDGSVRCDCGIDHVCNNGNDFYDA